MTGRRLMPFVGATPSRRTTLAALLGGLPGLLLTAGIDEAAAKKKGKGKHKKRCKKCGPCQKCQKGKCRPVAAGTPCGAGQQCAADGRCLACDVCASGCTFSSVQAAIDAAAAGETIRLCPGSFAGPLTIAKDLTLIGAGDDAQGTTLDGQGGGNSTVLVTDTTVTLEQMRITGGAGVGGGGIFNRRGTLTLTGCTVSGNTAALVGGGIANENGNLTLTGSTVANNESGRFGGGIQCSGTTLLINSTVRGNTATDSGGGIRLASGTLTLVGSRVEENRAASGGGINRGSGTVTLQNSVVTNNTQNNCSGGVPGCA